MEDQNLEQVATPAEQTPTVSGQEPVEPISKEQEPTSEGEKPTPSFTQEQLDQAKAEAVTKAKGEVQSAKDKEIAELMKRISETELAGVEKAELARWTEAGIEESEIKSFQEVKRKFATDKSTFEQEQVASKALAAQLNEQAKAHSAKELASQYGVDEKELLKAQSPEEMETIAVKLHDTKVTEELEQLKKAPEKIDSSLPSATGERSFKHLEQDYADGKIPTAEYEKALREQGKI